MINHFNFKKFGDEYLITNDLGSYSFLSKAELGRLITDRVDPESALGTVLRSRGFVLDGSEIDFISHYAPVLRGIKKPLFAPTSLHIFVVSTACNLDCVYCQAHDSNEEPVLLMDEETVERAIDIALESPTDELSFEFQGGEPLINFPVIRHAVEYAERHREEKRIGFSVVTNLTLLTDEMIGFFGEHGIALSTSIDGAEPLHDSNRPFRNGKGSFQTVKRAIERVKEAGLSIGGIQTTTRSSLDHAQDIVDTYAELGFDSVFLRPLTPLGTARARWDSVGYSPSEFGAFYRATLGAIIEKNASGFALREGHASMLLEKIMHGRGVNYMEMRSPCGASVGQMAYYPNGDVFTCDEGRMLFEMGDPSFRLGNVYDHSYADLMHSPTCRLVCAASTLESLPSCCDCVYQPFCGVCPVVNIALEGDVVTKAPNGYHCGVYSEIFDAVFDIIHRNDEDILRLLRGWLE